MEYRMLIVDIDGTLRPKGELRVPRQAAEAISAVQAAGVKVVIATGRGRAAIPKGMLRGIRPDYWVCSAGAQVLDAANKPLYREYMQAEEMYALVDFFEDYEYPLGFTFADGSYIYTEYDRMLAAVRGSALEGCLQDGEDQDHHLDAMPYAAFGRLPKAGLERFNRKYGYLGLSFLYYAEEGCDILRPGQDKAVGLAKLLEITGITTAQCVAVGDSSNDVQLLKMAGLGYCVQDGAASARQAADRIAPPAGENAVAAVCREIWPAAFAAAGQSVEGV